MTEESLFYQDSEKQISVYSNKRGSLNVYCVRIGGDQFYIRGKVFPELIGEEIQTDDLMSKLRAMDSSIDFILKENKTSAQDLHIVILKVGLKSKQIALDDLLQNK